MIKEITKQTFRCRSWLLVSLLAVLSGCVAPVYTPNQNSTAQIPAQNSAGQSPRVNTQVLKTLEQLTNLKEELKKLRNAVEEMEFNADTAKRRQQNLFQDSDRRLLALERAQRLGIIDGGVGVIIPDLIPGAIDGVATEPATVGGADVAVVQAASASGDDAASAEVVSVPQQQAYQQAFDLLKQSKYQDAIAGFQQLVDAWPTSQLADDAYYWMSEAYYVNREFESALSGFRTVTTRYPDSPRAPEALLKIGYIQYDIGAYEDAAEIFRDILARFPGHQVAVSAHTRLRRIEQTIQQ